MPKLRFTFDEIFRFLMQQGWREASYSLRTLNRVGQVFAGSVATKRACAF